MASFIVVKLDTTAPSNPLINLEGGAVYATAQLINAALSTGDADTTGFQMKIWGTIDKSYDATIQDTEVASQWITFATSKQIKLAAGDGLKTVYVKIRDAVYNVSAQASDTITLDSTVPVPNITANDVKPEGVSEQSGKDTMTFTFNAGATFSEYKVKVVSGSNAAHDSGAQLGTTNGSLNVSGVAGNYTNPITVTVKGADLKVASVGDGDKYIKVFIKSASGLWSV